MDDDQQFCLRWNNHQSTLVAVFDTLLENGTLVDCTLAAEGKYLNAHKVVLSACSPYFETLLSKHFDKHPIVVLKDVKFQELKAMMDYMYRGEVNISQDQLGALLKAAESLQIKGLSDNKRGETERKPVLPPKSPPTAAQPAPAAALPKVQGLTIEQRAGRDEGREGSASPGPRKKKRMRRKSEEMDNHHDASSSSESHSLPAAHTTVPALLPAISKMSADVPEPVETKSEILTRHKQPTLPDDHNSTPQTQQLPMLKEKIETHTELMLEPKAEYVEEMNEDSIEDLTLDDDDLSNMEQMDEQAGPSHGNAGEGSSQGFGGWHMGNQSQDEVFLAAQEAVGAHRDSQEYRTLCIQGKKTVKWNYTEDQLRAAIDAIRSGRKIREVGRTFNIPEATLRDKIKTNVTTKRKAGRNKTFSEEQEAALANSAKMISGITPIELQRLAYEYAEENKIKHQFNIEKKMAGPDWLHQFLKRHPEINVGKSDETSTSSFDKSDIDSFFDVLANYMEKFKIPGSRIFNVAGTDLSKPLGGLPRGKAVTVVCAVSALGKFIPPMFVFPKARMNPQLMNDGPVGAIYRCSKNGRINEDLLFDWFKHFHQQVKPTKQEKVLLISDTIEDNFSLEMWTYCRKHGIVVVSIPPHISHILQPLELAFFGPFGDALNHEADWHLRNRTNEKATYYDFASILNEAYSKIATVDNGILGFRVSGIWPMDPNKFSEDETKVKIEENVLEESP